MVRSLGRQCVSGAGLGGGSAATLAWSVPIAFVALLAAMTRFPLLGHQSLWYDEIVSLTLAKQPFGAMLHDIARTESTPPLYYVLLWIWERLFGESAEALRSLSAVLGVLTAVVMYLAARERFSTGAAVVAGAFTATSPMLTWYSQEARAYALVTFFVTCSLDFMLRARRGCAGALIGWSATACLALASHYFAVFVLIPEAAYLGYVCRTRLRALAAALVAPITIEAALLPLAIHQRDSGHSAFIAAVSLRSRIDGALNWFLLGNYTTTELRLVALWLLAAVAVIGSIVYRAAPTVRRDALLIASVGFIAFVLAFAVVPGSFRDKNIIVALPPLLLVAGVAFVPRQTEPLGVLAGLFAAALFLAPSVVIADRLPLQREDWRDMATLIGPPSRTRAVLAYPQWEYIALTHYRRDLKPITIGRLRLRELVVVGRRQLDTLRLPKGFQEVEDRRLGQLRMIRLQAPTGRTLRVAALHLHPLLRLLHQYHSLSHAPGQSATLLIERTR
jgi:mannosyltransferase